MSSSTEMTSSPSSAQRPTKNSRKTDRGPRGNATTTPTASLSSQQQTTTTSSSNKIGSLVIKSPNIKTDYVDYLTSYEHMVRSQDGSFDATVIHLRTNIISRLRSLHLLHRSSTPSADSAGDSRSSIGSLSSSSMTSGVAAASGGTSFKKNNNNIIQNSETKGVMMITYTNMTQCLQLINNNGTNNTNEADKMIGLLATDTQLVMLLTLLVESYMEYTTTKTKTSLLSSSSSSSPTTLGLCLPEFIQAYDIIVSGMQCLQQQSSTTTTTPPSSSSVAAAAATAITTATSTTVKCDDNSSISSISSMNNTNSNIALQRIKERTMEMIRTFGNPTSSSFTTTTAADAKLLIPTTTTSSFSSSSTALVGGGRRRRRMSTSSPNSKKKMFTNDEITTVMHTKDSTLSKIIEEHESEMEVLVSSITELQSMEERLKFLHQKRRVRLQVLCIVFIVSLGIIGSVIEVKHQSYRTQQQVVLLNSNNERSATTLQIINELQNQKSILENSLHIVQGKIRFEITRTDNIINNDIVAIQKQINTTNSIWYKDMLDIEQCYIRCDEINDELQIEQSLMMNSDEELAWCTARLTSRAMALKTNDGVGYDTNKQQQQQVDSGIALFTQGGNNSNNGGGVGNTILQAAKAMIHKNNNDDYDSQDDNNKQHHHHHHRPVYLEMKYSMAIRRAMILRQGYSILAGLGTSVIVQWLLKLLFFGPASAAVVTATTAAAAATAIAGPGVEMIVVDGIFGSSIGFLILRALAMFILP